jgi:purine-binding chemotaxis protein CheW
MDRQFVIFRLKDEYYGIDIAAVDGIIKMQDITYVPNTPDYIIGVTNLRGSVLPIIDLRKRFGMSSGEETVDVRIVNVSLEDIRVGMIVDSVSEVQIVSDEVITPTPSVVSTLETHFIAGIAKVNDKLVIILDLKEVLTAKMKRTEEEHLLLLDS